MLTGWSSSRLSDHVSCEDKARRPEATTDCCLPAPAETMASTGAGCTAVGNAQIPPVTEYPLVAGIFPHPAGQSCRSPNKRHRCSCRPAINRGGRDDIALRPAKIQHHNESEMIFRASKFGPLPA